MKLAHTTRKKDSFFDKSGRKLAALISGAVLLGGLAVFLGQRPKTVNVNLDQVSFPRIVQAPVQARKPALESLLTRLERPVERASSIGCDVETQSTLKSGDTLWVGPTFVAAYQVEVTDVSKDTITYNLRVPVANPYPGVNIIIAELTIKNNQMPRQEAEAFFKSVCSLSCRPDADAFLAALDQVRAVVKKFTG